MKILIKKRNKLDLFYKRKVISINKNSEATIQNLFEISKDEVEISKDKESILNLLNTLAVEQEYHDDNSYNKFAAMQIVNLLIKIPKNNNCFIKKLLKSFANISDNDNIHTHTLQRLYNLSEPKKRKLLISQILPEIVFSYLDAYNNQSDNSFKQFAVSLRFLAKNNPAFLTGENINQNNNKVSEEALIDAFIKDIKDAETNNHGLSEKSAIFCFISTGQNLKLFKNFITRSITKYPLKTIELLDSHVTSSHNNLYGISINKHYVMDCFETRAKFNSYKINTSSKKDHANSKDSQELLIPQTLSEIVFSCLDPDNNQSDISHKHFAFSLRFLAKNNPAFLIGENINQNNNKVSEEALIDALIKDI
ncbi:MAG: hypothetical protein GY730_07705, partial [bacterium]|nr:hypothetical protein [bacterium]